MAIKTFWVLSVLGLLLQAQAQADSVVTTVFNVFESQKTERLLILSGVDGRVYKAVRTKENITFYKSLTGRIVRISFNNVGTEAQITDVRPVNLEELDQTVDLNHFRYNQLRQFAPTELQTVEEAESIYKNMLNDGDKSRSECFKRAHMWSYDMWSKLGIYSQKIFIFYTKRYFLLEEFDWWFHVAPMVTAGGVDLVLDGTFMEKPMPVKEWADFFLKTSKINCPMVENYQQYEKSHMNKLCVTMKAPMYYLSPLDIEMRDKEGVVKNHWVLPELQDARRAFKNYEQSYSGLDTGKATKKY